MSGIKGHIFFVAHLLGLTGMLRVKKKGFLTVLSLHRISTDRNFFWNPIQPSQFELLIKYLKRHYSIIDFANLSQDQLTRLPKPPVIISFDDGYHDFLEYAVPILKDHGVNANHNVVNACCESGMTIWTERLNGLFQHAMDSGQKLEVIFSNGPIASSDFQNSWMPFYLSVFKKMLGLDVADRTAIIESLENRLGYRHEARMMTWDEVRQCSENGIDIGSHTFNHDVISTIKEESVMRRELLDSKAQIESKLEKPVNILALPNGQVGGLAYDVLKGSGYKYVLQVDDQLMDLRTFDDEKAITDISRINLVDESAESMYLRVEQFHSKLKGNA